MTKKTKGTGAAASAGGAAGGVQGGEEDASISFEDRLKQLEDVVARLESDEVPLEEAITLYEQGMKIHKACEKVLAEAQLRIEKLSRPSGTVGDVSGDDDAG